MLRLRQRRSWRVKGRNGTGASCSSILSLIVSEVEEKGDDVCCGYDAEEDNAGGDGSIRVLGPWKERRVKERLNLI